MPQPVDSDTVKVCRLNGERIGYWPASDGELVAQIRTGKQFRVTIEKIYPFQESSKRHGVALRIEVL
jgi:hypothetical protein